MRQPVGFGQNQAAKQSRDYRLLALLDGAGGEMAKRWLLCAVALIGGCSRREHRGVDRPAPEDDASKGGAIAAPTLAESKPPAPSPLAPRYGMEFQGNVSLGTLEFLRGRVGNAERVWAGMRAGFRACYNRALVSEPIQHGALRAIVEVGPVGQVLDARAEGGDGLAPETIECVLHRVKASTFLPPEPEPSEATLALPMTFTLVEQRPYYR